ncbi:adenylate/guanylate cyclase domain-containing protein [Candidatus Bipolaricaulota bacterium]
MNPTKETLSRVFSHLRTLYGILHDYMPRHLLEYSPDPGEVSCQQEEGTLVFTDLVGFTSLAERCASEGKEGTQMLLECLNRYFSTMIEVCSKSAGDLLEFTGDAMLVQFPADASRKDTLRAVRAGLRMQRAMIDLDRICVSGSTFSLGMRVGVHEGPFLVADVGTPARMEHILLGDSVLRAKRAETMGQAGRVNLSSEARAQVGDIFRVESNTEDYVSVIDAPEKDELSEYDVVPPRHRLPKLVCLDRSLEGFIDSIEHALTLVEPLAAFLPRTVLNLVVEHATQRTIPPDFTDATVMLVTLTGLSDSIGNAPSQDQIDIVRRLSFLIALINAEVEARDGMLRKVTHHLCGPDMLIVFGVPNAHADDAVRAVEVALRICELIKLPRVEDPSRKGNAVSCRIGLARGLVFAAEIGAAHGRRTFNVLGDAVNTAARLMAYAGDDQVLMTSAVRDAVSDHFHCQSLGDLALKGKTGSISVHALIEAHCSS